MKNTKLVGIVMVVLSWHWAIAQPSNINVTPATLSVSIGATATFRVTSSGASPFTYQWWFTNTLGDNAIDGVANPSALRNILNLTNVQTSAAGGYYVVVTDANSLSATSGVHTLGVDPTFTKITTGALASDLGCSWGCSWGDYDRDGFADLFVTRDSVGSALYHNNGDGAFTTITNVPFAATQDAWASAAWADFENNGRLDVVATRFHKPALAYFDNGDGTFSSLSLPIAGAGDWGIAVADYNRDGLLDVLLNCGVTADAAQPSVLYRNNGDRTFTRMTSQEAGPIVSLATFGVAVWGDYDDDGWLELYCPNWTGKDRIFHNDGTGRFVSVTNLVTQSATAAIGGGWGDYDNDGRLDLCAASWGGTTYVYHNLGNGQFERAATGLRIQGYLNTACWVDYDNDGFLDLFLPGQGNQLYRNNGDGSFTRVTTGSIVTELPVSGTFQSYSALWFDSDNDGFLDLYVSNGNDPRTARVANFFYHNNGNSNAWLTVKLVGTVSNRQGIGAKVRALATYAGASRWQRRDISGGDACNGNQLYAHFGLGDATNVNLVRIEWPSGAVEEFTNVAPRQMLTIVEPSLRGAFGTDGLFHLTMTGNTNKTYQLNASSDMASWTTLTNCVGSGTGASMEFVDPEVPAAHQQRLYYLK